MLKILDLIKKCNYFKNMVEENISQEFTLSNIDGKYIICLKKLS